MWVQKQELVVLQSDEIESLSGPATHVAEELGGFVGRIAEFINKSGQELSKTKCEFMATSKVLEAELSRKWASLNIKAG